jgi:glyoxylase-like metal-dependent hydrolase (beta-lactamase superfamily II)
MPRIHLAAAAAIVLAAAIHPLAAQSQTPAEAALAHLTKARTLAGTAFLATEEIQCNELGEGDPYHPTAKGKDLPPTRVFDNLFYIGTTNVGAWAVKTSAGIILINSLHTEANGKLLSGFKKLGLDPADVKYVIVTEADGDRYGNARYFQDKYAAQVIMSANGWDEMARTVAAAPRRPARDSGMGGGGSRRGGGGDGGGGGTGGRGGMGGGRGGFGGGRGGGGGYGGGRPAPTERTESPKTDEMPQHDQVGLDGETFTLGDETVRVILTPSHTPGTLSVIVPVKDHGEPHVAAVLGGTEIPVSGSQRTAYVTSALHFATVADSMHVDAELNSNPFVDNAIVRMDSLRQAGEKNAKEEKTEKNPFLIGTEGFQKYMGVIAECGWVAVLHGR